MNDDQSVIRRLEGKAICILSRRELKVDARIARQASALVEAGARVNLVIATLDQSAPNQETHKDGYLIHRTLRQPPLPLSEGSSGPSAAGAIWRYLRGAFSLFHLGRIAWRIDADVYHASDLQPLPVAWMVAAWRRKPLIYEAREISTDREAYQRFRRTVAMVEGFFSRRADGFLTTTRMRADYFAANYDVADIAVVQNRPIATEPVHTEKLRLLFSIAAEEVVCLYQGGLQQGRGLPELLSALVFVPNAQLVLLGHGNLRDSLQRQTRELGLGSRVHFADTVPWQQLPEWTASADIGIQLIQNTCLNHYTTDSNKLFEYAMAGLPVLASDFPEIRSILEVHKFGLLVDPSDRVAVVEALARLCADAALRRQLAESATKARQSLSWETQVPELLRLYEGVLACSPTESAG